MTDATAEEVADEQPEPYNGLPGAFLYAPRASDSVLFKVYVVLATLLSLAIVLIFGAGLIVLLGRTVSVRGGTFTFSRAFFLFVGFLVVAPLLAPILSVARRHRRTGSSVAYDRSMALAAFLFIGSLYVTLLITAPAQLRDATDSALINFLYGLDPVVGFVPPIIAVGVMYLVHRFLR